MITELIELTARGSLVFAITWLLDGVMAGRMQARSRRVWWWLVALAFLAPLSLRLSVLPALPGPAAILSSGVLSATLSQGLVSIPSKDPSIGQRLLGWLPWIWLAGLVASLALIAVQTFRTSQRWTSKRLCTDPALLDLLEDCKAVAGITAPIGLVLSDAASSPALLGWLRPRVILPAGLATSLSKTQLRSVLLHELAHFRALDVPLHWLFTLARAIHWFNPLVHCAAWRWLHQRELAADETALRWLSPQERRNYGEALVEALKHAHTFPVPYGALALGESIKNIKQRIVMITRHSLPRRSFAAIAASLALVALLFLQPIRADQTADAKAAAAIAADSWLTGIDAGGYETSWTTASALFKKQITSAQWQDALKLVRTPLGKCLKREVVSSLLQTGIPAPGGNIKGEFVVAQYESSYDNLKSAIETVTFTKESDGTWKAAGYFIKPN